jgi:hypothetical protein
MTTLPSFPVDGVVETYDTSDALGSIRLDNGESLRFGRSACSFDPVVGNRVRVSTAEIGPLGRPRASRVDALGPHLLTPSERVVLIRSLLLAPVDSYGAWGLACRLAGPGRPEQAAARGAIREELETARGRSTDSVDEMIALARWAGDVLGPRHGMVQHAIGDADDIRLAIDVAEREGFVPAAEAERLRARVRQLSD